MVTERDIAILLALVRYFVLNRKQVQTLVFPSDTNGRITRRRLQFLVDAKLINRMNVQTYHVGETMPPVVYFPSKLGNEFLSAHFKETKYLLTPFRSPAMHHVQHWVAVTETHICFDQAAGLHSEAKIENWLSEWDVANKDEPNPELHYRLYTLIRQIPKLVCIPDAAFLLTMQGHKKVFYIEEDRGTSGSEEVAALKYQGYAAMAEGKLHTRHFPDTNVSTFTVLMIAPNATRRDMLKKAMKSKAGAELWRFVDAHDMKPETLFSADILHPCDGPPRSLIRKKEGA